MRIILVLLLTSCTTPRHWSQEGHVDMLLTCSQACDKLMKQYTPNNGICECKEVLP